MVIKRSEFERYLKVQKQGKFNMFDSNAQRLSGLEKTKYAYILWHYDDLMKQFKSSYDSIIGGKNE